MLTGHTKHLSESALLQRTLFLQPSQARRPRESRVVEAVKNKNKKTREVFARWTLDSLHYCFTAAPPVSIMTLGYRSGTCQDTYFTVVLLSLHGVR